MGKLVIFSVLLLRLVSFAMLTRITSCLKLDSPRSIVRISEDVWRTAAAKHQQDIIEILQPGLMPIDDARIPKRNRRTAQDNWMTPLDPKHPVYNFLIEYYGLKGAKGPKQLARWSPSPAVLLSTNKRILSIDELDHASAGYRNKDRNFATSEQHSAVLLEGASEDDFARTLHLRGAIVAESEGGIVYSPEDFFGKNNMNGQEDASRQITPFLWYKSILQQTLTAEPILHCHGLHEWAMQYQPQGALPPPSAKYQAHLSLRVSREVINAAVERRGVSCTHVDALRFFAPAAGPLNHHGASLERVDQLRLEQPACVHAHMDMLKICLRLKPFCDSTLLQEVLRVALKSRRLDVAASPYDASSYGVGVVPIETEEGRSEYRRQQRMLMEEAETVRSNLLRAYELLLELGFNEETIRLGSENPLGERYAKAEPGGKPWRQNLIQQ